MVKHNHVQAQLRGEEVLLKGAPEGQPSGLNAARKSFASRFEKNHGRPITPADLRPAPPEPGEGGVLTEQEVSTLREASRIKTRARLRIERERAEDKAIKDELSGR